MVFMSPFFQFSGSFNIFDQYILYNDTNIAAEFLTLTDTETTNDYIEATATDGYAVAEPIIQDHTLGSNISEASSTADTLISATEVQDGNTLYIETNDGIMHTLIASSVEKVLSA